MIKPLCRYAGRQVCPRIWSIIVAWEALIAVAFGLFCGLCGDRYPLGGATVGETTSTILTYAAIALGFCLAGLTLAITLPNRSLAEELANLRIRSGSRDAYSDLLFIFSWVAIVHWFMVVALLVSLILEGATNAILPIDSSVLRRVVVGVVSGLVCYGVLMFLITLLTLTELGSVYVHSLGKGGGTNKGSGE